MNLFAGIDIGSTTTKVVLMKDNEIAVHQVVPTGPNCKRTVEETLQYCLKQLNAHREDIRYIVSTGYGRKLVDFAQDTVSEISANAKGAQWLNTSGDRIRTIVDIGGQDSKVISLNDEGKIINFAMNDKCAASSIHLYLGWMAILYLCSNRSWTKAAKPESPNLVPKITVSLPFSSCLRAQPDKIMKIINTP